MTTLEALAAVAGSDGAVRATTPADAFGDVRPEFVVEPESPEAVARVLGWAANAGRTVVVRGGGTKIGWVRALGPIDVLLSTKRLGRVLAHAHGDLTATVQAGTTLEEVNRQLGSARQWLPIETAFDGATIGGILASGEDGPLRQRYGTPRDLLIGVHLATTDGKLVKAGGTVVKNVAGYDLGKLVTGSFGGLAVIVAATFKLVPLAGTCQTVRARFHASAQAALATAEIASSQLEAAALEIVATSVRQAERGVSIDVLARFASTPDVVEAQVAEAERIMHRCGSVQVERCVAGEDEGVWREHVRRIWAGSGTWLRVSWLPASLGAVLDLIGDMSGKGMRVELVGRAGIGCGVLRVEGDARAQVTAVGDIRARPDLFEHSAVLQADPGVQADADVWDAGSRTAVLLRALKGAFDPAGVLGVGRGPA